MRNTVLCYNGFVFYGCKLAKMLLLGYSQVEYITEMNNIGNSGPYIRLALRNKLLRAYVQVLLS